MNAQDSLLHATLDPRPPVANAAFAAPPLLLCRQYDPQVYAALRDTDVADAAAAFARGGNFTAVSVLLQRRPYSLAPRVLSTLAAAPDTLEAACYGPILREIAALRDPPAPARPADWVESEATCGALRRRGEHRLLLATEHMARLNFGWCPPAHLQIAAWVQQRAVAIDRLTGQVDLAAALLETARSVLHYGSEAASLVPLQRAAAQLTQVLRLAAARGGEAWDLRLGQWAGWDDVARLAVVAGLIDTEALPGDISGVLVPFMRQLEAPAPAQVLCKVLEREAALRLRWVVRFVQLEAARPAALGEVGEVAHAACAAAYACPSVDSWGLQDAMLSSAAAALHDEAVSKPEHAAKLQALRREVELARSHLTAARLLTKHGLPTPLTAVRDADASEGLRLVQEAVRRAVKTKASESRWTDLWTDLNAVQHAGLGGVQLQQVQEELCRGLLECGKYRLAQSHLAGLDAARQEALVLNVARQSLAGEGDSVAAAKRSKAMLAVLPGSKAAREEARFVDAAQRLKALGVDLPPHELRNAPGKA